MNSSSVTSPGSSSMNKDLGVFFGSESFPYKTKSNINIENKTNWNSNTLIKTNLAKILKPKSYLTAELKL